MTRVVENYQDLQDTVADYLNRTDLVVQIPKFIYFGERKIFRWLRTTLNEKLFTIDMRVTPDTGDPTQVQLTDQLDLPTDYLDTLTLQAFTWNSATEEKPVGGRPLRRISQDELYARQYRSSGRGNSSRPGEPEVFARTRDRINIWPVPENDTLITWQYYCDLSGLFDTPTSDNSVLAKAPDMYVYAALLEAEPFLKPEDDAMARLPIWKSMYQECKEALIDQHDLERYSGSANEINNAWGGPTETRSYDRTGWA